MLFWLKFFSKCCCRHRQARKILIYLYYLIIVFFILSLFQVLFLLIIPRLSVFISFSLSHYFLFIELEFILEQYSHKQSVSPSSLILVTLHNFLLLYKWIRKAETNEPTLMIDTSRQYYLPYHDFRFNRGKHYKINNKIIGCVWDLSKVNMHHR